MSVLISVTGRWCATATHVEGEVLGACLQARIGGVVGLSGKLMLDGGGAGAGRRLCSSECGRSWRGRLGESGTRTV